MAPEQTRYPSPSHYSSRRSNRQQQQARECRTRPTCTAATPSVDAPGGHTTTGDPGGCGDAHDRLQDLLFPYSFIAPIHRHNTAHGPPPFPFRTETERFLASRATAGTLFPYVSQIPAPLAAAAGTSPAEAQAALCRLRRLQFRAAHKAAKLLARREACGDSDPHTVAAAERLRAAAAALVCIEAEDEASRPRSPSRLSARRSVSAAAAEAGIPVRSRAGGFDLTGPLSTWSSATWAAVRAMAAASVVDGAAGHPVFRVFHESEGAARDEYFRGLHRALVRGPPRCRAWADVAGRTALTNVAPVSMDSPANLRFATTIKAGAGASSHHVLEDYIDGRLDFF